LLAAVIALELGRFSIRAGDTLAPIVVLVRVHLVRSEQEARLQTTLTDADVQRIFGKVNKVWSQAGIRFELESVGDTRALAGVSPSDGDQERWVVAALPKERLLQHGINVCYVKELRPNGIWTSGLVLVKDTARLREVTGGLDEPLPRVTSHELGHALGLVHRQEVTNLMASGTTGFSLNDEEVQTARATAIAKFDPSVKVEAAGK
jgi:hypothetical protein